MAKARYKEKFIVINTKFFDQLNKLNRLGINSSVQKLQMMLMDFATECYVKLGVDLSKKNYYVCNQDEPYAQKVIDIILEGESEKI